MRACSPSRRPSRRGAVLVLMVLLFPVVLILCFMAINTAYMLLIRTELRVATDASVRAAGSTFSATNDQPRAIEAAQQIALLNSVGGQGLVLSAADVEFGESIQSYSGARYQFAPGGSQRNAARVNATLAPRNLFAGGLFSSSTFSPTQTATATYANVDICLVLDRSSSMKLYTSETDPTMSGGDPRECEVPHAQSRWQALETAVAEFVQILEGTIPVEHVAVVTYGSDYSMSCSSTMTSPAVAVDCELDGNLQYVRDAMAFRSSTVWGGMTEIHAGIQAGTAVLTGSYARPEARKVMIVLTDGHYTAADPIPYAIDAESQGIRVHAVTFGEGANQTDMQYLAEAGGGSFFHAPDPDTLEDVFRQLAAMPVLMTD